jgi:hypothetical protein
MLPHISLSIMAVPNRTERALVITGISIENFKGISERVTLDLRPITLLFGANSAGKSTILHALHYAREVFERHNLDADQTISGGQYVDLGGFHRFVHNHDGTCPVRLKIDISIAEGDLPSFDADFELMSKLSGLAVDSIASGIHSAAIELTVAWSAVENCAFVSSLKIFLNQLPFAEIMARPNLRETVLTSMVLNHPVLAVIPEEADWSADDSVPGLGDTVLAGLLHFCWRAVYWSGDPRESLNLKLAGRCDAFPDLDRPLDLEEELIAPDVNGVLWHLERALSSLILGPCWLIRDQLQSFRYLGPLRDTPPRNFVPPRYPDLSRWSSGLGAWDSLHSGPVELIDSVGEWLGDESHLNAGCTLERRTYLELDAADPVMRTLLNRRAFEELDEDESLDLSKVPMKSRIVILSGNSDAELRPHDVGIGISQVVPVIVTALDGEERLLAIEQPELHIHPRLQAAIGDLFIESIHKNKHCFIIETHSEHLILRLLRRIRETEKGTAPADRQLRTNELGIYYLKQENGSTTASRIDVDVKGEFIQPWPDDFFEIDFFERFPDAR